MVCEALRRRAFLTSEQLKLLEELEWRAARGLEGEMRADSFWEDLRLTEDYRLFHNLEVVRQGRFTHQIDTLFVCKKFVLIVELKHITGEIYYDEKTNQLWRMQSNERMALGDPFSQVMRHEEWLQHFLWELGIDLPILSAVVVTANRAIIGRMPERFQMFKVEGLRMKLQQWLQHYPSVLSGQMLSLLQEELLVSHSPRRWQHPFGAVRLRKGALCICGLKMKYANGVFTCSCGLRLRDRFRVGLHDYRLLVSETITNRAFREFFEIKDVSMVSKILQRLQMPSEGTTKSKKYYIPEDIWCE